MTFHWGGPDLQVEASLSTGRKANNSAVPDAGPASQDVEDRFVELERNTLEAMMRATDQKSTQQPGDSSTSSAGQGFDACWLDHWDA